MGNKRLLAALFVIILSSSYAFSATYFISPSGNDLTGNGSSSSPWQTPGKAFTQGGGHTYIFKDGVYNYDNATILNPPSGTINNPTIIKAEHDGEAILDGAGQRPGISIQSPRHFIIIEGFRVQNCGENATVEISSPDGTPIANQTSNITVRKVGAKRLCDVLAQRRVETGSH